MPESSVALNYPHQFLEERWWLLTPSIERDLSSFQHNVAGRLTERHPSRQGDGSWEYPSLEEAMVKEGFKGIGAYITRRQKKVAHYIATRTNMNLCERSARRPGARVSRRWWEKDALDLEGAKKRVAAAAELDGE